MSNDDDFANELRDSIDGYQPSPPPFSTIVESQRRRRRARRVLAVTASVVAVAGIVSAASLLSPLGSSAKPVSSAASATPSASASPRSPAPSSTTLSSTPASQGPTASSSSSVAPPSAGPSTVAIGSECTAADLTGADPYELPTQPGQINVVITLKNTSQSPCELSGFPTIRVTIAATGKPLFAVDHATTGASFLPVSAGVATSLPAKRLTLRPTETAYVYLALDNSALQPNLGCDLPRAILTLGISGQSTPVFTEPNFLQPGCLYTNPAQISPFTTVAP